MQHPPSEVDPSAASPAPRRRSRAKTLGIIAAIAAPTITIAAVAIPILANLGERSTSIETIEISETRSDVDPIGSVVDHESTWSWTIDFDAPIETFPIVDARPPGTACTDAELEWLQTYAEPLGNLSLTHLFEIEVSNTATTGGALSLSDIHFETTETEPTTGRIELSCPGLGGTGGLTPATLRSDGSPAVYADSYNAEQVVAGTPAVLNLGPGETQILQLGLDSQASLTENHTGNIVATAQGSEAEPMALATNVTLMARHVPGYTIHLLRDGGGMSCERPGTRDVGVPCTAEEARELMRQGAESVAENSEAAPLRVPECDPRDTRLDASSGELFGPVVRTALAAAVTPVGCEYADGGVTVTQWTGVLGDADREALLAGLSAAGYAEGTTSGATSWTFTEGSQRHAHVIQDNLWVFVYEQGDPSRSAPVSNALQDALDLNAGRSTE